MLPREGFVIFDVCLSGASTRNVFPLPATFCVRSKVSKIPIEHPLQTFRAPFVKVLNQLASYLYVFALVGSVCIVIIVDLMVRARGLSEIL